MPIILLDIPVEVWLSHYPRVECDHWPEVTSPPEQDRTLANLSRTCATAYQIFMPVLYSELFCNIYQNCHTIKRLSPILQTLYSKPELGLHVRRLSLSIQKPDLEIEDTADPEESKEGREVLDLVLARLATDRKVLRHLWDVQNKLADDEDSSTLHPHRIHIVTHLLLSPLKHLRQIHTDGPLNVAMFPILCPNLASVSCMLPAAPTLKALLQHQRLRKIWFSTNNNYPLQLLENMPTRQFTCESLSITLMDDAVANPVFELAVATELVKKFKSIETFDLTLFYTSDELHMLLDNLPKSLKALFLHLGSAIPNCLGARCQKTCLKRFTNLEYLEMPPELLLGYEPCKHNKASVPVGYPTLHPSTLAEELLPQSLKYLTFIVDKLHTTRNGDDYFTQIILPLVWHPQILPDLRAITLYEGPQIRDCFHCENWYDTGESDAPGTAILLYELTRLDRLCHARGLFLYTCGISPREVPATCEGRGLILYRVTKINSRRSWQGGTPDDVSLLELFNTSCFVTYIDRRISDVELLRYLSFPVFQNRSFVVS